MPIIEVPPGIIDRALAVVVDEARAMLAVWKGRSRIDVYGLDRNWHQVVRPYALEEEGMWSREDIVAAAATLLGSFEPPADADAVDGPMLSVDLTRLREAGLVRARQSGYAIWDGNERVDVFTTGGHLDSQIHAPGADLAEISQLMTELLDIHEWRALDLPVLADDGITESDVTWNLPGLGSSR